MYSKTEIDRAGRALSKGQFKTENEELESEIIFDDYRQAHLQPLTETTHQLQTWLSNFDRQYYIAQRLKRKPQILRKMHRFSVRLTQLQDIGGNRVIVDTNDDVEALRRFLRDHVKQDSHIELVRETDYRALGRDDTGYRALHMILSVSGVKVELQLRSRAQHYWAEAIERTSVIYGHHLKENAGDQRVIDYFKSLSYVFFEFECRREPTPQEKIDLDGKRELAESIIEDTKKGNLLHSHINDDVLYTLTAVEEGQKGRINNWILIFDWNSGCFVNWESISRNPGEAYQAYSRNENFYREVDGYEVVLVGSSDVSMIRRTHSHYFGIDGYDSILESLEESVIGFSTRRPLNANARRVLHTLFRKNFWGRNTVTYETLNNHFCKSVRDVDIALQELQSLGLIDISERHGQISLRSNKHDEIKSYL